MGVGTGHGVIMDFLDPDNSHAAGERLGTGLSTFNQPLPDPQRGNTTGRYLIRDLQLHEESGPSSDISHLSTNTATRWMVKPDLYDVGTFSFNVLFDTTVQDIFNTSGDVFNHPLPRIDNYWGTADGLLPGYGGGPVLIYLPLRLPASTQKAYIGPRIAWVTSRSWGNWETNAEVLCSVTMQWQTAPDFSQETAG